MIKMFTISTVVAASMLASGFTATSVAAPFVDINFDSDAIGSAPSTAASTNPLVKPTAIGGYDTDATPIWDPGYKNPPTASCGTILVQDVGGMSKAAQLTTNSENAELGALWIDTSVSYTSQQVRLSFDVDIIGAPNSATSQVKTLNGSGAAGILLGMNTFGTAPGAKFAVAPTSATGGVFAIRSADNNDLQSFFTYTEGTTYNVALVSDYDTGVVSTYVDGVFTGSKTFASAPAANVTTQEFFFHLNGEASYSNIVAIDNISAVPEPASIGLLGVAGLAMLKRRRRTA